MKHQEVINFQKYWEQQFCSAHFVLPQTDAHWPYQREVSGATLNLHHFLQKLLDLEVQYVISSSEPISTYYFSPSSYVYAKSTDRCTYFEGLADHDPIKSTWCGNKKKHKVEKNLPLNTRLS
jgi:hypothetical protein